MARSVKNYTNRFMVIAILLIMAVWALLFYAVIMDEVYDNIDDGLKNQKILILREAYIDPDLIDDSREFGINQFRILPAAKEDLIDENRFSKEFIYMPYDEEEEPYRILRTGFYDKKGVPYRLEIRTSTVEEDDFLINLAVSLGVLYLVLVLSIMVINHYVLKKAWKPFQQILHNLSRYRFGEAKSFDTVATSITEFGELNGQIKDMIDRNEKVFDSQKRFIENAAHELQTPVAITNGKLDLLLEDDSLSENQLTKIAEAKQALVRMSKLNKSLLMLSRIENHQYTDIQEVDFNAVLHQLAEDLGDMIDHRKITLRFREEGIFYASCNKELVSVLLSNLFRNAIKYNIEGGQIDVEVDPSHIRIANTGSADALNPDYIYERFHKGAQDSQSNGLGLSIVRSILQTYPGLSLIYSFENGVHVFSLTKNQK